VIYQMAERWGLAVAGHGREPRRFVIVHVTSKSKVPVRSLLPKTPSLGVSGSVRAPPFNAQVDMEPGLVVGLLDLPREADVSTLVLRFGGECELVWLNDKNALAIFADGARAATALRRVDHASEYKGATTVPVEASSSSRGGAWGIQTSLPTGSKTAAFRKGRQDSNWVEDAWDDQGEVKQVTGAWQSKVLPFSASQNPWGALASGSAGSSSGSVEGNTSRNRPSTSVGNTPRTDTSVASASSAAPVRSGSQVSVSGQQAPLPAPSPLPALLPDGDDDDWEKAL
jgi:transcriptional repressor NF-X1